jgi:AcrR family transcriptional regulator
MPRAALTPSIVVAEAARLADEVGYDQLTLALLAVRLGVQVPSLYKHVNGLDAVRRAVAIAGVRELGTALEAALTGAPAGDPHARLRALAHGYRRYAVTHPGRYAATVRAAPPGDPEHGAASNEVLQTVLAVLGELGLEGDDAVDAARTLRAALHGFVALESAGGFGLPRDVERSFGRLVEILDRGLAAPDRIPGGGPRERT